MQTGVNAPASLRRADRAHARRRMALPAIALLVLFFAYLSMRSTVIGFIPVTYTLRNIYTAISLGISQLFRLPLYDRRLSVIQETPYYLETMTRLQSGLLTVALGACLSAAGAAFQMAFRNPIAMPGMLGVSGGISAANTMLVLRYSTFALSMTAQRFIYGYAFSLALLAMVLLTGRLMGSKRFSVIDMILAGSIITRLVGQISNAIQVYAMTEEDFILLQEMSLYGTGTGSARGAVFLAVALMLGLLPLFLTRFSFNGVSFDDESAKGFGINAARLRAIGLVCSVILVVAALIHAGDVALLALLAPHLGRYMFGADFRDLLPGSLLLGALLMLVCGTVTAYFAFYPYLRVISVGIIVSLVATPLLMVMLLRGRRGWE